MATARATTKSIFVSRLELTIGPLEAQRTDLVRSRARRTTRQGVSRSERPAAFARIEPSSNTSSIDRLGGPADWAPRRGGGARWDAAQMAVNDAAALSIGAAADVLTILEYHDSKDVRMARVWRHHW